MSGLLMLAACGTFIEGQTQRITLSTPGAYESRCTLDNGNRYVLHGGETGEIMRSHENLVVDCYATGNRHKVVIVPTEYNDWSTANILNGAVPGMAYDHVAGGLYSYPDIITVDFYGAPTLGFETPAYQNKDAPNPYNQAIENFGPTVPKGPSDGAYLKRGVGKRDASVNSNPFATSPAAEASPPATPAPTGRNAEELNRSMNPAVFNP